MSKVNFRLKTDYKRKDGTCPLYAQVYLKGKMVRLPVNVNIEQVFWDPVECRVHDFHPEAEGLNP